MLGGLSARVLSASVVAGALLVKDTDNPRQNCGPARGESALREPDHGDRAASGLGELLLREPGLQAAVPQLEGVRVSV